MDTETATGNVQYYDGTQPYSGGPTITLKPGQDYEVEGFDYRTRVQRFKDELVSTTGRVVSSIRDGLPRAREVATDLTNPRWLYHTLISPDPLAQDLHELKAWVGSRFAQKVNLVENAVRKTFFRDEIWSDFGNYIAFSPSMAPMLAGMTLTASNRLVDGTFIMSKASIDAIRFTRENPRQAFKMAMRLALIPPVSAWVIACGAKPSGSAAEIGTQVPDTKTPVSAPATTRATEEGTLVVPTDTATPEPTDTPAPTDTPTKEPTETPTDTPTEEPTEEPTPKPTDTPAPERTFNLESAENKKLAESNLLVESLDDFVQVMGEKDLDDLGIKDFDSSVLPSDVALGMFNEVALSMTDGPVWMMKYPAQDMGYPEDFLVTALGTGQFGGYVESATGQLYAAFVVPGYGKLLFPVDEHSNARLQPFHDSSKGAGFSPGDSTSFALTEVPGNDVDKSGKLSVKWAMLNFDAEKGLQNALGSK